MFLDSMESPLSLESIIYGLIMELILGLEITKKIGLAGFARSHCSSKASNFGWSEFLRPNSVSDVLRLYEKTFESRIHPYIA